MRHPSYTRISQIVRRKSDWTDEAPLHFAEENADLYSLSFASANSGYLVGRAAYQCPEHDLRFDGEPSEDEPADCDIVENRSFRYPLLREASPAGALERHRRLIVILHGLNERSFGKYLPWAYQLWRSTGAPVLLFPQAFHVNRVLPLWGRRVARYLADRQAVPRNENVHAFNAVISERLDARPERFFWGGMQSYWDLTDLARQIRSGAHPHVHPEAQIDFIGYSAGGYLALGLLLENEDGLFADSRAVVFESCVTFRDTSLSSRFIIDLAAELALMKLYVKHTDKFANARLMHWLTDHPEGQWFRAFCGLEPERPRLEARLQQIAPRLLGLANLNDRVMPCGAMLNALQGIHRDTGVRVEELTLGIHENPFCCPDYNQRDRKFVAEFLDSELYGRSFENFIERTLSLIG